MIEEHLDIYLGDEVLDIGSGNQPCSLSTVLADLTVGDDRQRSNHELQMDGRPFVNCSIEYLPFRDKAFDHVIASHVLEHTDNPVKACEELQRVASRGYIETPSQWLEQGYYYTTDGKSHWEWHNWYVWNPSQTPKAFHRREIGKKICVQRKDPYHFDDSRFAHTIKMMLSDIRLNLIEKGGNNDTAGILNVNTIIAKFSPDIHHMVFHWDDSFQIEEKALPPYLYQHQPFDDIRKGEVFVDVGAFDGDTIAQTLDSNSNHRNDITIVAIEPYKESFERMKKRFKDSNLKIHFVNKAAWDSKTEKLLFCIPNRNHPDHGWSVLRQEISSTELVQTDTLDNILDELNIQYVDYIKIDTEGAEPNVLRGFTKYKSGTRFHVEFHGNYDEVMKELNEKGMEVSTLRSGADPAKEPYMSISGRFI